MSIRTITTHPGKELDLTWTILNSDPLPNYHLIIKDYSDRILLENPECSIVSGFLPITAPLIPARYPYTITVIRNDFGLFSDVEQVFLNVTQTTLSDIYIDPTPTPPGAAFVLFWTVYVDNPQPQEFTDVTVFFDGQQWLLSDYDFSASYRHGEPGHLFFVAPVLASDFPIVLNAVDRYGSSDTKTIFIKTYSGVPSPVASDGPQRSPISLFSYVFFALILSYVSLWAFIVFSLFI